EGAGAVARGRSAEGPPPGRGALGTQGRVSRVRTNPAYIARAPYNRRVAIEPARPRHPGRYRKQLKSSLRWRPQAEWLWVPIPAIIDEEVQGGGAAGVGQAQGLVTAKRAARVPPARAGRLRGVGVVADRLPPAAAGPPVQGLLRGLPASRSGRDRAGAAVHWATGAPRRPGCRRLGRVGLVDPESAAPGRGDRRLAHESGRRR